MCADPRPEEEDWPGVAAQVCAAGEGGERAVQQLHAPGATGMGSPGECVLSMLAAGGNQTGWGVELGC